MKHIAKRQYDCPTTAKKLTLEVSKRHMQRKALNTIAVSGSLDYGLVLSSEVAHLQIINESTDHRGPSNTKHIKYEFLTAEEAFPCIPPPDMTAPLALKPPKPAAAAPFAIKGNPAVPAVAPTVTGPSDVSTAAGPAA